MYDSGMGSETTEYTCKTNQRCGYGFHWILNLEAFFKDHEMVILNVKLQHTDEITDSRGE